VTCNGDGSQSQLPAPCEPVTYRVQGEVSDEVNGELLRGTTVVVTDRTGTEHTVTTNSQGIWSIDALVTGNITIHVSLDLYSEWEFTLPVMHDLEHGSCDTALSPHLDANSWRAVLTWVVHPRDLDGHVTRHPAGQDAPTLMGPDCGGLRSQRSQDAFVLAADRDEIITTNPRAWRAQTEDLTKPGTLDRDNVHGNEIPETITYFRMDTCEFDRLFV